MRKFGVLGPILRRVVAMLDWVISYPWMSPGTSPGPCLMMLFTFLRGFLFFPLASEWWVIDTVVDMFLVDCLSSIHTFIPHL